MSVGQGSRNEILSAALASVVALQLAVPLQVNALDYRYDSDIVRGYQVSTTKVFVNGIAKPVVQKSPPSPPAWEAISMPTLPTLPTPSLPTLATPSLPSLPTLPVLPSLPSLSSPDSGTEATLAKAEAETAVVAEAPTTERAQTLKAELEANQAEAAQAREEAQQAAKARNRAEMTALADVQAEAAKMQASAAFAAKTSLVESSMRGKLSLETDEVLLREEDRAIRALDSKIKGERKVEKVEKAQLKKKNDALLAAVKAGDMSAISVHAPDCRNRLHRVICPPIPDSA